ncbi:GNAT family N-acetyltransferase [Sphingomonas koreensis]|nr:GNAT family N-acetyltransferase [Sphingomonas koreensis]
MQIRKANESDVAGCVAIIEARRLRYAEYEPRFWKKAANSGEMSKLWFAHLFARPENVVLVAVEGPTLLGFVIAVNYPAPPIVDLPGKNALIDDFAVISDERWMDVGTPLLAACKEALKTLGYIQIVVIGAPKDVAKTAFLEQADLSLASTWWTAGL